MAIDSDDSSLAQRFKQFYSEGAISAPEEHRDLPSVKCVVRSFFERQVALVQFDDPEVLDSLQFCKTLFPDRGYIAGPACTAGWASLAASNRADKPFIAIKDRLALVDLAMPWQSFVANYAINRVLRRQRDVMFFHASSVEIAGHGVMLVGPKGTGKTTTAMTLASRGNGFGGDEIAPVCTRTRTLLPFRRAVSIKAGPRAAGVDKRLTGANCWIEEFPDGTTRTLAAIGNLFPESRRGAATLSCVFFLKDFQPQARVYPFVFGREHYHLLTPLAGSMWGVPAAVTMLQIARMVDGFPCFFLSVGGPDETAELIERTVLKCAA